MTLSAEQIAREVRYTRAFLDQTLTATSASSIIDAAVLDITEHFRELAGRLTPLRAGDRAVVSLFRPRTAALFADRVWCTMTDADQKIAFGITSPMELRYCSLFALHEHFGGPAKPEVGPDGTELPIAPEMEQFFAELERDLSHEFQAASRTPVVPLFSSVARRDAQYQPGDQASVVAVVDNLGIVDEGRLTWEQVTEFRDDEAARQAYQRFVHWMDAEMTQRPVNFIADELARRLELYEWALKKHGIQTALGTLATALNTKSLLGSSSVGVAIGAITAAPIWGLAASGGILLGRAAVSLATMMVEREDLAYANRELAYVQEVRDRFRPDAPA